MKFNQKLTLLTAVILLFSFTSLNARQKSKQPVDYVNPFLGSDFFGHTFPGASVPNALVHLSPDVYTEGWTYCAGYIYQSSSIMGFSHTHWNGVGMVNGGEILLMPTVNTMLQVFPGSKDNPDEGYRSRFDHKDETASPGYYSVLLKDYNIKAELTSTKRAGIQRYTFPESENARIILDVGHQIGDMKGSQLSELRIVSNTRIEGSKSAGLGMVHFVAEFSKPFAYYGTFDTGYGTPESGAGIFAYKNGEKGDKIGAFLGFNTKKDEQILVKVGISYVSVEGARKNLETEIPHWDFDKVRNDARNIWNEKLSRVTIEGATDAQKETFYTASYRTFLAQYISQDVDGKYWGSDHQVHETNGYDFYGSFSCWDTYRTQHPLITYTSPENVNDMIKSIVDKVKNYGWLPAQHFLNVYGEAMVGDHLIPIIVDAYKKGYRDYDVELLYAAMRKKALEMPKPPVPHHAGRSGLEYYIEVGYAPIDKVTEAVPNTMELAYDDWCIAQLAKELGKEDDYQMFMKRAHNYENIWDPETEFMRPRKYDGTFLEELNGREQTIVTTEEGHHYYKYFDPLLVGRRPNRHYTESNAWQYIWSVQHDVHGLINLFGSNDKFIKKLDTFFTMDPTITPPKYVGVVGTLGQYVHGNQPSHHVTYLYNYAGQPWKTQYWARMVMDEFYRPGPAGLCGNEDMGSLSSWYVLSSMGFYPVCPGDNTYAIGSPLFGKATMKLGNGKTFTIIAKNNSSVNKYIQSATLNGKAYNKSYITHDDIINGSTLIFEMGPEPNKNWGMEAPPSMSK